MSANRRLCLAVFPGCRGRDWITISRTSNKNYEADCKAGPCWNSDCAAGVGAVWVLTISYPGGRTKQISLPPAQIPTVRQWLRNYRKLKANLERICELNHRLLRPEKKP